MKNFYYVDATQEVQGPLPLEELDALHRCGKITAMTQVCLEGTEVWTPF
ncbi:MAG: GYF domain-containing protein [Verrucomicrobiales bacterium]